MLRMLRCQSETVQFAAHCLDRLTCPLPDNFARALIFPEPEKDWLTETVIARPLRELDLANHHRLDPMTTFHLRGGQSLVPTAPTGGRQIKERAVLDLDLVEL